MATKRSKEGSSRERARRKFWAGREYDSYACPDCDRGLQRAKSFHVHHIDGDPMNNDDENLIGLCERCHKWRHDGKNISGLDNIEWRDAFLEVGSGKEPAILSE